jgi:hypothetical protein
MKFAETSELHASKYGHDQTGQVDSYQRKEERMEKKKGRTEDRFFSCIKQAHGRQNF